MHGDPWRCETGRCCISSAIPRTTRCGVLLRAAIVVPVWRRSLSFAVSGDSSQTPLFTIFGSVALLMFVDFPGNRPNRALAYAGLALNGAVLITLGTLVAAASLVPRSRRCSFSAWR